MKLNDAVAVKVGDTDAVTVYVGADLVWSADAPAGAEVFGSASTPFAIATSRSVTLPAGIEADDLIVVLASNGFETTAAPAEPSGYTQLATASVATNWRFTLFRRWAVGNEGGTSVTVASPSGVGARISLAAVVVRGLDVNASLDVASQTTAAATANLASPTITSSHDPRLVLWFAGFEFSVGNRTATVAAPSDVTVLQNTADSSAQVNGSAVAVSDDGSLSAGNWVLSNASDVVRACVFGLSLGAA